VTLMRFSPFGNIPLRHMVTNSKKIDLFKKRRLYWAAFLHHVFNVASDAPRDQRQMP
jgi:hypothetical protein